MTPRFMIIPSHGTGARAVDGVTIDAPHSMDLDDAIWLDEAGGWPRVTVSIADAAGAVPKDSPLDCQARQRGFSRYNARGIAPMLPRSLSEDGLSLLPGRS